MLIEGTWGVGLLPHPNPYRQGMSLGGRGCEFAGTADSELAGGNFMAGMDPLHEMSAGKTSDSTTSLSRNSMDRSASSPRGPCDTSLKESRGLRHLLPMEYQIDLFSTPNFRHLHT